MMIQPIVALTILCFHSIKASEVYTELWCPLSDLRRFQQFPLIPTSQMMPLSIPKNLHKDCQPLPKFPRQT